MKKVVRKMTLPSQNGNLLQLFLKKRTELAPTNERSLSPMNVSLTIRTYSSFSLVFPWYFYTLFNLLVLLFLVVGLMLNSLEFCLCSAIVYVYIYWNNPEKHSHHLDIRSKINKKVLNKLKNNQINISINIKIVQARPALMPLRFGWLIKWGGRLFHN